MQRIWCQILVCSFGILWIWVNPLHIDPPSNLTERTKQKPSGGVQDFDPKHCSIGSSSSDTTNRYKQKALMRPAGRKMELKQKQGGRQTNKNKKGAKVTKTGTSSSAKKSGSALGRPQGHRPLHPPISWDPPVRSSQGPALGGTTWVQP